MLQQELETKKRCFGQFNDNVFNLQDNEIHRLPSFFEIFQYLMDIVDVMISFKMWVNKKVLFIILLEFNKKLKNEKYKDVLFKIILIIIINYS